MHLEIQNCLYHYSSSHQINIILLSNNGRKKIIVYKLTCKNKYGKHVHIDQGLFSFLSFFNTRSTAFAEVSRTNNATILFWNVRINRNGSNRMKLRGELRGIRNMS